MVGIAATRRRLPPGFLKFADKVLILFITLSEELCDTHHYLVSIFDCDIFYQVLVIFLGFIRGYLGRESLRLSLGKLCK